MTRSAPAPAKAGGGSHLFGRGQKTILYGIVPAVAVAAVVLGYWGDRYAGRLAGVIERSILDANRTIADEKVNRIEQLIIDTDRTLFYLADLEKPKEFTAEFRARWKDIVRLTPTVDSVVVLDARRHIVQRFHKERGVDSTRFEERFAKEILPDLDLASLSLNEHRHLHKEYGGDYYLISYIAKTLTVPYDPGASGEVPTTAPGDPVVGERYYVAIKANLEYIRREIFREMFADLDEIGQFAVIDEWGRTVFGRKPDLRSRYLYEKKFPTTVYQWRLLMTPSGVARLVGQARQKRWSSALLFSLTVTVIFVGLGLLVFAVQKEHRLSVLKSDFISNVSHELKTPLSLIRMFGELLLLGKVKGPEHAHEYHEIINREAERLTRVIDNVLDFARLEQGKSGYDFRQGNLRSIVERTLDIYRLPAEREGIELSAEVDPDLPLLRFDEAAMTLVMLNLLDNAFKYGVVPDEKGRIAVSVGLSAGGAAVELAVTDEGPGIRHEDLRRIWERFYRAPQTRAPGDGRRVPRGSGIGLALVKHIAEAHSGRASVQSPAGVNGRGARFVVTLPTAKNLAEEAASES